MVETIPRDIYQNIVFPSQQYRISLIRNSQDLTLWMLVKITPEMFRNNNFVNKDGQQISFGRILPKRWPDGIKHSFPLHKGDMKKFSPSK